MISQLSILIPTRNNVCVALVKEIQRQAEHISNSFRSMKEPHTFCYEIIVADDGSDNHHAVEQNMLINNIPNCTYIIRKQNVGRAAIRNFLAQSARFCWLLYIDSGMTADNPSYLNNWLNADLSDITYGGYTVSADPEWSTTNLRYKYESRYERKHKAAIRNKNPYLNFHTSNFIARREVVINNPFNEQITTYGYEDVLWGKKLKNANVSITHNDNTLTFKRNESNEAFISKTEEAMKTLLTLENDMKGYSGVTDMAHILQKTRLLKTSAALFKTLEKQIRRNLTGNKPSLFLFNIYKLGYFITLKSRQLQ
ncbi:MAG: glycosyltransferase family 2 protein [Prevotella sp.]|nr:glycosyltransferase family 2 protein [Prevotella sp.]